MEDAEAWLAALARTAREEDVAADPRWDEVAAGKLSADQQAALRARSTAAQEAFHAFEPLSDAERDEIEARVVAALGAVAPAEQAAPAETAAPAQKVAPAEELAPASSPRAKVVVVPWWRRPAFALAAAGSLAAVLAALVVLRPARAPALPAYALALASGEGEERGAAPAPGAAPRLGPGSRVELILRPERPVQGPIAVRGALVQGGRARAWTPPVEISPDGAVRIAGTREAVFPGVPDGAWDIVLAVGRAEALPADPAAAAAARDGTAPDAQLLRAQVVLAPAGQAPGAPPAARSAPPAGASEPPPRRLDAP
ncbi:uncharacterized protein SOCE26_073590 [Sorangium cellulosum]|uniref:Uncharacterized protein n=1 Tax=Sorangium cellulosum TaxID=56 RepID=A0A2L0F2V3_SORCE|nr:hypothetical protein [Sorangium cellulosum]AUX45863.1 uncharacterized protein SOCE26_073590 [Sorangium cellulosum]